MTIIRAGSTQAMRRALGVACGAGLLVGLPAAGVAPTGRPLADYLQFPPLTRYVPHAPFAWWAFVGLALALAACIAPFALRVARTWQVTPRAGAPERRFPDWGWAGVAAGVVAWAVAWTRLPGFEAVQRFTFSPQWLAYIVVVNALTWRRTGRCLLTHEPLRLTWLFGASAGFWWYFEYLNRFVQNWHYEGIGTLTPGQYFGFATGPFATVLPAVLGTYEWLAAMPRTAAGLDAFAPFRPRHPRGLAVMALAICGCGLAGIGIWPDALFPLLWISPLVVLTAVQALRGQPTVLDGIARGDWQRVVRLALAALICGFFWEMWNAFSLARWVYSVPFVDRFHLFEMPILGFAGYLPFGLECGAIADLLYRREDAEK